jgi:hypothetical protein
MNKGCNKNNNINKSFIKGNIKGKEEGRNNNERMTATPLSGYCYFCQVSYFCINIALEALDKVCF